MCCVTVIQLLIGLSLLFTASTLQAQWPPEPTRPAPIMQTLHLDSGRFVPSTRRWNLVWADQIIPNKITPARFRFAAEHYVATQKIWSNQAAQFRAINPNFLVIAYHLAAGLNPHSNSDCPDPKSNSSGIIGSVAPKGYVSEYATCFEPWLAASSIAELSARYEAMFQHYDQTDSAHRVWHQDPAWLMNISNSDYQQYIGDVTLDWMRGNANEGCFFDVAVETNSSLYNPKASDPSPVNFDWWAPPHAPAGESQLADRSAFASWMNQRYLACYQNVYKRFHTGDTNYLVIPNTDQMVTTVYDPTWTDGNASGETIDGAMMEGFGSYRGSDMWLTLDRAVRHLTGRGKILIAQFYNVDSTERLRRTAMYMLVKNENSFLNILNADGVEWYPEYEIDLGDQSGLPSKLDSLRISGSASQSVWSRDYARGRVLCNTSDAAMDVDVPAVGQWAQVVTHGGGRVADDGTTQPQSITYLTVAGHITIPPSAGVILARRDAPSEVGDRASAPFNVSISPGASPSAVQLHLTLATETDVQIFVVNLLGQQIATISSGQMSAGEHVFNWFGGTSGVYECIVRASGQIRVLSFAVAK